METNEILEKLKMTENPFHPMVFILGTPEIGEGTYIGLFSEINSNHTECTIGKNCDIASFVSINCADSHRYSVGLAKEIERLPIHIEDNVFIGSHCFIGGGTTIGHHSVVAAGSIVIGKKIPPYSLVVGNPAQVKEGYYKNKA